MHDPDRREPMYVMTRCPHCDGIGLVCERCNKPSDAGVIYAEPSSRYCRCRSQPPLHECPTCHGTKEVRGGILL